MQTVKLATVLLLSAPLAAAVKPGTPGKGREMLCQLRYHVTNSEGTRQVEIHFRVSWIGNKGYIIYD